MNHISELKQNIIKSIDELPETKQNAILWLIANYDTLVSICRAKPLSMAQREFYIENAIQRDDMYTLSLILLERMINS